MAEGEAVEDDPEGAPGTTVTRNFGRTDSMFELVPCHPAPAVDEMQFYLDVALLADPDLRAARILDVMRRHGKRERPALAA